MATKSTGNREAIAANKAERASLMQQWDVTGVKPVVDLAANLDALEALCKSHKGVRAATHCNDTGAS